MRNLTQLLLLLFLFHVTVVPALGNSGEALSVVSGVIPHHLLAKEIMVDFFSFIARGEQLPDTIILLSPDHLNSAALERGNSFISVNWELNDIRLGDIAVDGELLKKIATKTRIRPNPGAVLSEFGIMNLLPLIKEHLPGAKIVPILIPANISREEVGQLVNAINQISSAQTIMVASVDFSHYLPSGAASFHDVKSIRVLLNGEEEHFENIEVDSWQSLYAVRLFARLRKKEKPVVIAHKNSVDFLSLSPNETTSYFSVVFEEGEAENKVDAETILFAGDMMLGRGIAELNKKNGIYYPFQKIGRLLRGVDVVFANLEGPVGENPPEFLGDKLQFIFLPPVLEGVSWSRINLVSLANNHITDRGAEGLQETRDWLDRYQICHIGNPLYSYQDEPNPCFSTEHSVFLAFNRVLPFIHREEEIVREIRLAKIDNPDKFIIVSVHWGEEYQLKSSPSQRQLARRMIAAGADIVVGHHPHVVQEIELIQGRPVFYSLGNFIFDQQSIPETQEGLIVGLAVEPDRATCYLFPIQHHLGQPMLMSRGGVDEFLIDLSEKSDKKLGEDIRRGIIEITR